MKSRSVLVVIVLGAIGFGGYKFLVNRARAQSKAFEAQYDKDFFAGRIKPLTPPFVEAGNIDDLQFRVIPLPKLSVQSMSFDGDLLCVREDGSRHPKTWVVVNRDGQVKSSFSADRAYMTRTGKVVSLLGDSENSVAVTYTDTNGQKHQLDKNSYATSIAWTGPPIFTSMGFFDSTGKSGTLNYHDLQLDAKEAQVPGGGSFVPATEVVSEGTVGNIYPPGGGNTDRLGIFKDGKLTDESISIPHEYFRIFGSKSGIAVTSGRAFHERVPYRRTGPDRYERIAVPQGSMEADVLAINDRGDSILSVAGPVKQAVIGNQVPYDSEAYLVTNGKYYNLRHIHQMLFGTSDNKHGEIQVYMLDEMGDMVATTENGTFLIQPLSP